MDSIDLVVPLWLVPISHDLCVRDNRRQHALVLEPVDILCLPFGHRNQHSWTRCCLGGRRCRGWRRCCDRVLVFAQQCSRMDSDPIVSIKVLVDFWSADGSCRTFSRCWFAICVRLCDWRRHYGSVVDDRLVVTNRKGIIVTSNTVACIVRLQNLWFRRLLQVSLSLNAQSFLALQ
jgi:hypothetical protein